MLRTLLVRQWKDISGKGNNLLVRLHQYDENIGLNGPVHWVTVEVGEDTGQVMERLMYHAEDCGV